MVECSFMNLVVVGSSPVAVTKIKSILSHEINEAI